MLNSSIVDEAIAKVIREHCLGVERLTEAQFVDALKQALASGDFMRHIQVGSSAQAVTYVPFREVEALRSRIRELEAEIERRDEDDHNLGVERNFGL